MSCSTRSSGTSSFWPATGRMNIGISRRSTPVLRVTPSTPSCSDVSSRAAVGVQAAVELREVALLAADLLLAVHRVAAAVRVREAAAAPAEVQAAIPARAVVAVVAAGAAQVIPAVEMEAGALVAMGEPQAAMVNLRRAAVVVEMLHRTRSHPSATTRLRSRSRSIPASSMDRCVTLSSPSEGLRM